MGIERAKAEGIAVGVGAVAACATAIADGSVDCETAPTPCAGTICWLSCSSAVGGERVVTGVAFNEVLKLGVEFIACPEITSAEKSNVFCNIVPT